MPPKGSGGGGKGPSKKTVQKAQDRVVQDKTFGLKNKNKSAKVQKYVQAVHKQVTDKTNKKRDKRPDEYEKSKEAQASRDDPRLFAPVASKAQKLDKGVDPKSVLCEYFRAGACRRGDKCKFSHDLAVERKVAKIDLYTDIRSLNKPDSGVPDPDADRLDKVCRFFLQAVEEKKYGWFWQCPNGDACAYRHALPQGYVIKDKEVKDDVIDDTPLEELIEEQRASLTKSTPLTLELFLEWKAKKRQRKEQEESEKRAKAKAEGKLSGREMFVFNPDLFIDDDSAMESEDLKLEEDTERGYVLEATGTSLTRTLVGTPEQVSRTGARPEDLVVVNGIAVDSSLFLSLEGIPELEYD